MTILKHCRCQDCGRWIQPPYSMCRLGIIVNGLKSTPEFPADAWHWCARYNGPPRSTDVWEWPA